MVECLAGQLLEKILAHPIVRPAAAVCSRGRGPRFAASLCDHPPLTLLAVQAQRGERPKIRERFSHPQAAPRPKQTAIGWHRAMSAPLPFHELEGDIEPDEEVDLLGMIKADRMTTDRT